MGLLGITSLYFSFSYIAVKRWADSKIVFIVILSYIICGYFYDVSICNLLLVAIYRICITQLQNTHEGTQKGVTE